MYSGCILKDLIDDPVFMISFFIFWVITVHLLFRTVCRKPEISDTDKIVIIHLLWILMILSFFLCAILKASF